MALLVTLLQLLFLFSALAAVTLALARCRLGDVLSKANLLSFLPWVAVLLVSYFSTALCLELFLNQNETLTGGGAMVWSVLLFTLFLGTLGLVTGVASWPERAPLRPETIGNPMGFTIAMAVSLFVFSILLQYLWPGVEEMKGDAFLKTLSESALGLLAFFFLAIMAAIYEELIFRSGLQTALHKLMGGGVVVAALSIVICAVFFAAGHSGMVEPIGFKETQILVVGIGFGVVRYAAGTSYAVGAHVLFNILVVLTQVILHATGND
jgi:membrane protease YdiL (CAAX protease family)